MKKTRVLVVEDDSIIAGHIKITLQDLGYYVSAIADPADQ